MAELENKVLENDAHYAPPAGPPAKSEKKKSRVVLVRVGKNPVKNGVVMTLPDTIQDFFKQAALKLSMREVATKAWDAEYNEITDIADIGDEDVVYIGTRGEDIHKIYAKLSRKARAKQKVSNMFSCCKKTVPVDPKATLKRQDSSEIRHEEVKEITIQDSDTEVDDEEEEDENGKPKPKRVIIKPFYLQKSFDVSRDSLSELFNFMDKEKKGVITPDDVKNGLKQKGLQISDRDYDILIKKLDVDQSGDIQEAEFVHAIQDLAQRARFFGYNTREEVIEELFCYDYGPDQHAYRVATRGVANGTLDIEQFLNEQPGPVRPMAVRWVGISGHDPVFMEKLSKIYRLHQFEIEDAMEYNERARVVHHDDKQSLQIMLRVLRPSQKPPLKFKDEQFSIFLFDNALISIQEKATDFINLSIQQRIPYAGSKVRMKRTNFLVFSIIDRIVDGVESGILRFTKELTALEKEVHAEEKATPETMKDVSRVGRQMNVILGWIRPTRTVVHKLKSIHETEPQFLDDDMKKYYQDVLDHIDYIGERASYLSNWCKNLNEHYLNVSSHKTNQVMFLLTAFTVIFIPCSFIAGVYGMNFDNLPELHDENGYYYFWVAVFCIAVSVFGFFKKKGWL